MPGSRKWDWTSLAVGLVGICFAIWIEWRAYLAGRPIRPAFLGVLFTAGLVMLLLGIDRLKGWHLLIANGLVIGFFFLEIGVAWYACCGLALLGGFGHYLLVKRLGERLVLHLDRNTRRHDNGRME